MSDDTTFGQYLRAWFDAGRKGTWDLFGVLTTLAALGLWIWSNRSPTTFKAVTAYFGVTPEAAMSDWVWQAPLGLGLLALAYRFIRAPYEIHLASQRTITDLRAALARGKEPTIRIEAGGFSVAVNDPEQRVTLPGLWVACYDVVITNRTETQIPIEMWMHIGMREDGSWRVGETCRTSFPAWALEDARARDAVPFERVVNLPSLAAQYGFCAARFSRDVLTWARVSSADDLGKTRPFWIEAKNKLTKDSTFYALNATAARVDIRNS